MKRWVFIALTCWIFGLFFMSACRQEPPSPTGTLSPTPTRGQEEPPPLPPIPSPTTPPLVLTPSSSPQDSPSPAPPDGAALLRDRCSTCHALNRVQETRKSRDEWERTVDRMIRRGAQLNPEERDALIAYLAQEYGP